RLHLDEHDRRSVAGDDVNFSSARAIAARKNCVPTALQFGAREVFAKFSERLASVGRHGHEAVANDGPRRSATKGAKITKPNMKRIFVPFVFFVAYPTCSSWHPKAAKGDHRSCEYCELADSCSLVWSSWRW